MDSLRSRGTLTNNRVIEALTKVPRGDFVPDDQLENAYIDSPLRLENWGFNISAPHMYCVCLEALNPQPGMSFLDIGRLIFFFLLCFLLFSFFKIIKKNENEIVVVDI